MSSFSVSDVTDEHNIHLGVFTKTIVRALNRYLFLMKDIFHVSSNICKLCLLPCYLRVPFHQLASPPGFHVEHIPKGNLILLCINVFFWRFRFFSVPAAGLLSGSGLRGTQGARRNSKCGPWPTSVARALGVQIRTSPRGVIPGT